MRKLITVLALAITVGTPATALAQPKAFTTDLNDLLHPSMVVVHEPLIVKPPKVEALAPPKPAEPVATKPPEPLIYTVIAGDNLTKIGTAHNTEWQRIWSKNEIIKHPDVIHIGDQLTIPVSTEVLAARELPAVVAAPVVTPGVSTPATAPVQKSVDTVQNFGGGNTYDYGYCTWYVKNRRGNSLPNTLGNANTWFARAQAAGMATGYAPRAGAVGTTTRGALGHVIYVEAVNGDGTIQISEMNAPTFGVTTYRTANASEFSYIY